MFFGDVNSPKVYNHLKSSSNSNSSQIAGSSSQPHDENNNHNAVMKEGDLFTITMRLIDANSPSEVLSVGTTNNRVLSAPKFIIPANEYENSIKTVIIKFFFNFFFNFF